jgi:hypothetical protein
MLPQLTRKLRLALVLATAGVYVGVQVDVAAAKGKKSKDKESDDSDDGDDTEEDDSSSKDEGEGEGEEGEDKDQPPVTAGGLFTLKTYPTRENLRPLTMTQNILQVKASLGTDISNKGAFGSLGFGLEGIYGLKDNFTLRGGFNAAYLGAGSTLNDGSDGGCDPRGGGICPGSAARLDPKQFNLYAGFEAALLYDLFDIRLQMRLNRRANAVIDAFCSPANTIDPTKPRPVDPTMDCINQSLMPTLINIPNGNYLAGPLEFAIDIGFPFRYAIKPEIAITALDTFMAINLTGRKPDFLPSIGVAINPIAPLSIVLYAQLLVLSFDFTNSFIIPATLRVQVSPTSKLDVGLEFTFLNLKPPADQQFFDNRFISLFATARFGR